MTVERQDFATFLASKEDTLAALVRVLDKGQTLYSYVNTTVDAQAGEIRTKIKPKTWPISPKSSLTIRVEAHGKGSRVTAQTRSPFFVMADAFDYYPQYLRELFRALMMEVLETPPSETPTGSA
ncbi:MAG TPA: hypothetical protein PLJ47_03735 [Candidatus Hydrogenedentes bacterium]|nr:hypothetical protein [Candidatus Hydrogenedentota bacterium]